ncbi:MAG: hypothetical protein K8R02_05635 [Anaerohalosphaeraceae bacterium]|nr:hypothetical protein [Anaerohalosphaeraceae bacterium]
MFLQDGLLEGVKIEAAKLGDIMPIAEFEQQAEKQSCLLIVGKSSESHIAALLKENQIAIDNDWLGRQGYQVVAFAKEGSKRILMTAATDIGVLYGVIGLRLKMDKLGIEELDDWNTSYRDRPVFRYRYGKGELRGNWQTSHSTREPMHDIFLYEDYPEIFPDEEFKKQYLKRVAKTEKKLRKQLTEAEKYGIKVFFFTYQPTIASWGRKSFFKVHPEAKAVFDGQHKVFLCPSTQISKKFTYSKWQSLFKRFPTASGVLLCMCSGDGAGPYCGCEKCKNYPMHQRVIDYVMIVRSAIKSVNPEAVVVVRSWGLPTDMVKLAKDLPDDVCYYSKLTCPPGNDYLWLDHFCRYLEADVPRLVTGGTCVWNTDSPSDNVPFLCYTGPKQKARAVKIADRGVIGAWAPPEHPRSTPTNVEDILRLPSRAARLECAWDPYTFDPNEFLQCWTARRFGKDAGLCVYNAFEYTHLIADAFTAIAPKRTNIFHMFTYPDCRGAGYGGAVALSEKYPPAKKLLLARPADVEQLKKQFEIAAPIKIAIRTQNELNKAAKLLPENKEIQTYLTMANVTVYLTQMWRDYHLSLLYRCVEKNSVNSTEAEQYAALAKKYAEMAHSQLDGYLKNYLKIYPGLLNKPYYLKHPGLYNAFIVQQVNNAYHQAVLKPQCEKLFPVIRSRIAVKTKPTETNVASEVVDITQPNAAIVKRLHRNGPQSTTLEFDADLSAGGAIYLVYQLYVKGMWCHIFSPYDEESENRYNGAYANLEITLDGKKIATLKEFMTRNCRCNLLRYVKLPASSELSHKLKISLIDGNAVQFQRLYIYGPSGSRPITPSVAAVPFAEDFSLPRKWKTVADKGLCCRAEYKPKLQAMETTVYRQPSAGVIYMDLPNSYGTDFVFECDMQWSKVAVDSAGYFKLFGGSDKKQWRLCPVFRNSRDRLYGPTREGHYGLTMIGSGQKLTVKPFVMDAERNMVTRNGLAKKLTELKIGEKYHLKISRFAETAHFTITDSRGEIVMDEVLILTSTQDFTINKLGLQNYTSKKEGLPVIVNIDNVQFR